MNQRRPYNRKKKKSKKKKYLEDKLWLSASKNCSPEPRMDKGCCTLEDYGDRHT